jgi:hypothetical protein
MPGNGIHSGKSDDLWASKTLLKLDVLECSLELELELEFY